MFPAAGSDRPQALLARQASTVSTTRIAKSPEKPQGRKIPPTRTHACEPSALGGPTVRTGSVRNPTHTLTQHRDPAAAYGSGVVSCGAWRLAPQGQLLLQPLADNPHQTTPSQTLRDGSAISRNSGACWAGERKWSTGAGRMP